MAKFCHNCGNEVVEEAVICPKCGVLLSQNRQVNNNVQTNSNASNGMAVAGFILSFLLPLLGLIFSIIGINKSKETNTGRGLSIAGIIISSIELIIALIASIFVILVASEVADNTGYSSNYSGYYYNYYD